MRLKIHLATANGKLSLPIQYNNLLQGLIYNNLNHALSTWLHEKGHTYELRRFKLFTFSRLFGKTSIEKGPCNCFETTYEDLKLALERLALAVGAVVF